MLAVVEWGTGSPLACMCTRPRARWAGLIITVRGPVEAAVNLGQPSLHHDARRREAAHVAISGRVTPPSATGGEIALYRALWTP